MRVSVRLFFDEEAAARLSRFMTLENVAILRDRPDIPLLYRSHVVYRREAEETWSDCLTTLLQGWEDCDSLSTWRAAELRVNGWRALEPGYRSWPVALANRPRHIHAETEIRTRSPEGEVGNYHVLVRYRLGGRWFYDDPSARLGMYGGRHLSAEEVEQELASQEAEIRSTHAVDPLVRVQPPQAQPTRPAARGVWRGR